MCNRVPFRVTPRGLLCFLVTALALTTFSSPASAAVLLLDSITRLTSTTQVDLTSGNTDWAYWAPTGTVATPADPTNRKLGGALISSMTNVGGTGLRGSSTSSTVAKYNYTDGTNPTSATNASLAGLIFNSSLGSSADGKGLSLTLAGDPSTPSRANLYFGGFSATGNLTLTLNGATTILDSSQIFANNGPKQMAVYSVIYQPDSASDLLTIKYTASGITDVNSGHVGAQAVTVAPVPEPAAISLLAAAGLCLLTRRRRAQHR